MDQNSSPIIAVVLSVAIGAASKARNVDSGTDIAWAQ